MATPALRCCLIVMLALLAGTLPAVSIDPNDPRRTAPVDLPPPAVNTICPVSGDAVGNDVPPLVVMVRDAQGGSRAVSVGACCSECVVKVRAEPQRYGDAALGNRRAGR